MMLGGADCFGVNHPRPRPRFSQDLAQWPPVLTGFKTEQATVVSGASGRFLGVPLWFLSDPCVVWEAPVVSGVSV